MNNSARVAFALAVLGMPFIVLGADPWWSIDKSQTIQTRAGMVETVSITVDVTKAEIHLTSIPFELPREADANLQRFLEHVRRTRRGDAIVISGGFSSYRQDVPLGLFIANGRTYSPLATEKPRVPSNMNSLYARFRWSGIFCQSQPKRIWEIIPAAAYKSGQCVQALQAGPVPVEPISKIGISPIETTRDRPYKRLALCLVDERRIKAVLTLGDVHLYDFAKHLSASESRNGAGCQSAINLAGDSSAGIGMISQRTATVHGDGTFPIPNGLVIQSR